MDPRRRSLFKAPFPSKGGKGSIIAGELKKIYSTELLWNLFPRARISKAPEAFRVRKSRIFLLIFI